jgi:hypothetical protein
VLLSVASLLVAYEHLFTGVQMKVDENTPATAMNIGAGPQSDSPELAVDPTNSDFVALATRVDAPDFGCGLELSGDGGRSWVPDRPVARLPSGVEKCYAPEIAFGPAGAFYYLYVGLAGKGNEPVGAYLESSHDRGRSFSPPVQVLGSGNFGVRLAIDRSWGHEGRIHLVWIATSAPPTLGGFPATDNPILASYSDDGGHRFSTPTRVSNLSRRLVVGDAVALGPRHSVVVAYYDLGSDMRDYGGLEGPTWTGSWSLVLTQSLDAGASFGPGQEAVGGIAPPERVLLIYTMPPPALAVAGSEACLAWTDSRYGDPDVLARCLRTSGDSPGPVTRVNDDTVGNGHRQYLPAIVTSSGGQLKVVYLDRRDPLGATYQPRVATSGDYARSFSKSQAAASAASNAFIGARYSGLSAADQVEYGSRLGIIEVGHSTLLAWPDTRNTSHSTDVDIMTTRVTSVDTSPWVTTALELTAAVFLLAALVVEVRSRRSGTRMEEAPGIEHRKVLDE